MLVASCDMLLDSSPSLHAFLTVTWLRRHPAFYCFHQLNAFESGDDIVVDLAAYPDHSIMVQTHRTNMLFGLNPMDAAIPTRYQPTVMCTMDNHLSVSLNT